MGRKSTKKPKPEAKTGPPAATDPAPVTAESVHEHPEAPASGEAPAPAHPPRPPGRWGRVGRRIRTGALLGGGGALGVWVGDVVALSSARENMTSDQWLTGLGAALFVALTTAVVAGAVLGPLLAPAAGRVAEKVQAIRGDGPDGREKLSHGIAAQALTFVTLVPLMTWVAYRAALVIPAEFARAESIAVVLALSHLVIAASVLLLWPGCSELALLCVRAASRVWGPRQLLARAWALPTLLCAMALACGALLVAHRPEAGLLPWRQALPLPGLVVGLAGAAYLARRRIWIAVAIVGVALVYGGLAAARLHPQSTTERRFGFEDTLSGRAGYALWTRALDFDHDGQISLLGGGDCAPFDPRRHTGAIDIPGNGVDEDCDGDDLSQMSLAPRARKDVGQEALPRQPTIVLVTVDGLAARKLRALSGTTSIMPNIDDLAAGGVLFTRAFSQGPSTRLSFPSIFTSRWDSQLRQEYRPTHPYPLAGGERQLQDILDEAGYETIAVIPNSYFSPRKWPSVTRGFERVDASAIPAGKHNAPQVTDAALQILAEPTSRPRYLWIHYYDAHTPYGPVPGGVYANESDEALYDGELTYIDREIGRLIGAINGRPQPTYIILTADHGTLFGNLIHPGRHHQYGDDLTTATIHVPLIVQGPHIAPRKVDGLASTMDIVPTITDLLRAPEKMDVEGTSLWPEILRGETDANRILFHEIYLGERDFQGKDPLEQVSVRDKSWNLILDRVHGSYHLYDYTTDYAEAHDLFEEQASSSHARQLRSLLGAFVERFHRRAPGTAVLARPADAVDIER